MKHAPTIDGTWSQEEWKDAVGFDGFTGRGTVGAGHSMREERRARASMGAAADHIFVAIRSELPRLGELIARSTNALSRDDSIEVWVDPTSGSEHGKTFQMLSNSAGRVSYICYSRGGTAPEPNWNGESNVAHRLKQGEWTTERAIPIAGIAPGRHANDGTWAIKVCRNWKQPWAFSSLVGVEYRPQKIRFTFGGDVPVVQHTLRIDTEVIRLDDEKIFLGLQSSLCSDLDLPVICGFTDAARRPVSSSDSSAF